MQRPYSHSPFQEPFMEHIFNVKGMSCGHCEKAVTQAIRTLDPQAQVQIDRQQDRVQVQSDQSRESLATVIVDEGYAVV
jgi:copper chaperone